MEIELPHYRSKLLVLKLLISLKLHLIPYVPEEMDYDLWIDTI